MNRLRMITFSRPLYQRQKLQDEINEVVVDIDPKKITNILQSGVDGNIVISIWYYR